MEYPDVTATADYGLRFMVVTYSIKEEIMFFLPSLPPAFLVCLPLFLPSMLAFSLFQSNYKNEAAMFEAGENEAGVVTWSLERTY